MRPTVLLLLLLRSLRLVVEDLKWIQLLDCGKMQMQLLFDTFIFRSNELVHICRLIEYICVFLVLEEWKNCLLVVAVYVSIAEFSVL